MRSYRRYNAASYGSLPRYTPARIPNDHNFHPRLQVSGGSERRLLAATAWNPYSGQVQKLIEAQYVSGI